MARPGQPKPHCKECHKEKVKEWQKTHPEKFKVYKKRYQQKKSKKAKKNATDED